MQQVVLPEKPIVTPCTIAIAGQSMSGKSTFAFRLFKYQNEMFSSKPTRIIYCFKEYSSQFENVDIENIEFHYGIPSEELLQTWIDQSNGQMFILCFDDLMESLSTDKIGRDLTSRIVHHGNVCLIYILQNLFFQGKSSRTNSLNTHYFCLTRNCRDRRQIQVLGSQIFGQSKGAKFSEVYKDAVDLHTKTNSSSFPYLFISCHPNPEVTHKDCQLFTNIFPDDPVMVLYKI